jgi:hypothetical protein
MKYAPYDYMVFSYSHRKELPRLYHMIEGHAFDYECLLKELKESFTKNEKRRTKKYKRYVSQCIGEQFDKRFDLMMDRWADKKKTLKKTKYYVDTPKRGYVTKEYPLGKDKVITSYKPSELGLKKYIYPTEKVMKKYAKNLDKLDILYAA